MKKLLDLLWKMRRKRLRYGPPSVVKVYIDTMVKEVNKGNMRNNVISTKVWQTILRTFNERTGCQFDMKQTKQKFNRLRQL